MADAPSAKMAKLGAQLASVAGQFTTPAPAVSNKVPTRGCGAMTKGNTHQKSD